MSNRRKDRPVPVGFTRYEHGQYNKRYYTVITYTGVIYQHCWPNAGTFHSQDAGKRIRGIDVFAIKEEDYDLWTPDKKS